MNAAASNIIVESFLKGVFGVFDAMLSLSFNYKVSSVDDMAMASLGDLLDRYPVVMQAKVKGTGDGLVMMFSVQDATRLVGLAMGGSAVSKLELDKADLATLKEVADACLGGGVSNVMDRVGHGPEQLLDTEVVLFKDGNTSILTGFLGVNSTAAVFDFMALPEIDGAGVFVFAQGLESLVPPHMTGPGNNEVDNLLAQVQLSDSEMNDILSGFTPGSPANPMGGSPGGAPMTPMPANIERVMDIRLVCTARLGSIEMPIGEILSLGPGSIIEVGHLIDEPVELLVNDKLVARGDVVVVDEKFGLRITEIITPKERVESLR